MVPESLPDANCQDSAILVVTGTDAADGFQLAVPEAENTGVADTGLEAQWRVDNRSLHEEIKRALFPLTVGGEETLTARGDIRATFNDGRVDVEYNQLWLRPTFPPRRATWVFTRTTEPRRR